jgi:hypothetical protein
MSQQCDNKCGECCSGLKVELLTTGDEPLISIAEGDSFKIKVTALQLNAVSQVNSFTGGTLILYDASKFPTSGSGCLRIYDGTTKGCEIQWTGKSGNQLTGVTGHNSPPRGTTLLFINKIEAPATGYARTAKIYAAGSADDQEKPLEIELDNDSITFTGGDNGVKEITTRIKKSSFNTDQTITITVMDENSGTAGRCGSADTNLILPCGGTATAMRVAVAGSTGTINWCGETWVLPGDSGVQKTVCSTNYTKQRSAWFNNRIATHSWKYAGSLNLYRYYQLGEGVHHDYFFNNKNTLSINPGSLLKDCIHFTAREYANPPTPINKSTSYSQLGMIINEEMPEFNNYDITDAFFGSHTISGVIYSWAKGPGW